jgi:N-succinyldiaminopimelate aminotransferase
MSVSRLKYITKIGVEQMGDLADSLEDPSVLRLENLDTDLRPPDSAIRFTREAVLDDAANSYLPFFGLDSTRKAAAHLVSTQSGQTYDWKSECIISAGGLSGLLNVLLATIEPGDHVLLTDPTYVGLINRVRLAGGIPRFVKLLPTDDGWRLDREGLSQLPVDGVTAALIMSPSMPTGCVLSTEEWQTIIDFCKRAGAWLIYDAAMERILFDDLKVIHPASFPGMRDKVITVGAATKEYRMIGWRVGWIVGPAEIIADVARVSITNVVCQTGIAMGAVATAIRDPDNGIADCTRTWQMRRNILLEELEDLGVIKPQGGWSLLMDVSGFGMDGATASERLLKNSKIAATPMVNWGSEDTAKYIRFVYSNEPRSRLTGIRARVQRALEI